MRDLPRGTQVVNPEAGLLSSTGLSPALAHPSRCVRLATGFVTLQGSGSSPVIDSYNPSPETPAGYLAGLVWAIPVSLATTQGIISFPPATEMFQFAGLPPPGLCVQPGVTGHDPSRVSPFGHPRINVCSRLPGA
jgi:hypothetical protein